MNNATALPQPVVKIVNHQPMTSSIEVARFFGKEHHHVLKAIKKLELSEEFSQANFRLAYFTDAQGKKRPMYEMTRNGFAFVGLGFTGKEAARFKEAYIKAFDLMEAKLRNQASLADRGEMPQRTVELALTILETMQASYTNYPQLSEFLYLRTLGLTQEKAGRACNIELNNVQIIERRLKESHVTLPNIHAGDKKRQIRETMTRLLLPAVQAGTLQEVRP